MGAKNSKQVAEGVIAVCNKVGPTDHIDKILEQDSLVVFPCVRADDTKDTDCQRFYARLQACGRSFRLLYESKFSGDESVVMVRTNCQTTAPINLYQFRGGQGSFPASKNICLSGSKIRTKPSKHRMEPLMEKPSSTHFSALFTTCKIHAMSIQFDGDSFCYVCPVSNANSIARESEVIEMISRPLFLDWRLRVVIQQFSRIYRIGTEFQTGMTGWQWNLKVMDLLPVFLILVMICKQPP